MIRINLLPAAETARVQGRRQDIALGALALGGLVVVLFAAHGWQKARLYSTNRTLRQVTQELEAIKGPYADVQKLEQQKQELREKLRVIGQLEAKKVGPVRILAGLSEATPEKLWLTEFTDSAGTLKLTGLGSDEQTIADFMRRLGTLKFFRSVDLDETSQVTQDGAKVKKFVIRAQMDYADTPPPEAAADTGARGKAKKPAKKPASRREGA
jgi:type IV pilus assembly protein PilN